MGACLVLCVCCVVNSNNNNKRLSFYVTEPEKAPTDVVVLMAAELQILIRVMMDESWRA